VEFTFSKAGFYPVKKSISVEHNTTEDVKIVLRKIGELPEELIKGNMFFSWQKEDDGKIVRKGWSYKKDEDGDIQDAIIFNNPKDVEFYIEKSKDGKSVYLISNNRNSGFAAVPGAKNFTYLDIAPEKGYCTKVEIKKRNDGSFQYFYLKLHDKLYGKLKVGPAYILETMYKTSATYFINPSGSRIVTTTDED
jgi:hypothetical protein